MGEEKVFAFSEMKLTVFLPDAKAHVSEFADVRHVRSVMGRPSPLFPSTPCYCLCSLGTSCSASRLCLSRDIGPTSVRAAHFRAADTGLIWEGIV